MLLYLNFLKHCLYGGMSFKVARDVTAMTHPTIIPSLVDDKKRQIVTKFASLLFNTQVELIWQTRDANGSQVPHGTSSCYNRMIQPL